MSYLYIDIETIAAQSAAVRQQIAATVSPPGSMKKAETIAQWEAEQKPQAVKEAIAKTALDGTYGHICCIGYAFNDEQPKALILDTESSEADIITEFVETIDARALTTLVPTIVGHNVVGFDIRFIWQRAIVNGIRLPGWFPRDPKPWGNEAFDTMLAWAGARGMIGLDRLSSALGLDGKSDIDGSMIGDLWAAGEYQRIAEYCCDDVARAREIHRRMQVAYGEAA